MCTSAGWKLIQARFYTGIPDQRINPFWHKFWNAKLPAMGRQGVIVVDRPLHYRKQEISLPDGTKTTVSVGTEKGIDIRIALDIIHLAHEREYDVALIFSQDQDLSEVATEIPRLAKQQGRWIKIASAFELIFAIPTCEVAQRTHAQQIVFSHNPRNPLVICDYPSSPHFSRDSSIPVTLTVFQNDFLDCRSQLQFIFRWNVGLE